MPESKNSKKRIEATEKQRLAIELRKAGLGYEEIARRVGYSGPSGAYNAIQSALKKVLKEPAEELRTLEASRLDEMLLGIWPDVKAGSLPAIDRAIKLMERRAKMLGLDKPITIVGAHSHEISGPEGEPIQVNVGAGDDFDYEQFQREFDRLFLQPEPADQERPN